jgi:hypothetical protein
LDKTNEMPAIGKELRKPVARRSGFESRDGHRFATRRGHLEKRSISNGSEENGSVAIPGASLPESGVGQHLRRACPRKRQNEADAPSRIGKPLAVKQELSIRHCRPARIITQTLALTPGTRLGVNEVTAQIGEGGWARCIGRAIQSWTETSLEEGQPRVPRDEIGVDSRDWIVFPPSSGAGI